MGRYAVIKDGRVQNIAVADSPVETDGLWVCIDDLDPMPVNGWAYEDGVFSEAPVSVYVPIRKIKNALVDVWANLEASAEVDVQAWVTKINGNDQVVYDPQYDADLKMLVDKGLITPAHVYRLVPYSQLFGG